MLDPGVFWDGHSSQDKQKAILAELDLRIRHDPLQFSRKPSSLMPVGIPGDNVFASSYISTHKLMNQLRSGTTPQPRPYISVPRHYCNMTVPQAVSVSFCTPPEPFSCPARTLPASLLCLFCSAGVALPHNTRGTPVGILYQSNNMPVTLLCH